MAAKNTKDRPATRRPSTALECRNFWRAGSYEVASAAPRPSGILSSSDFDRARVHPKFLHSNATSHKWAFGAIAELLDNAVDEICNGATFVILDKIDNPRDNSPVLLFQDDGGGMDPEGIRKCMSLGFSSKKSKKTIGQYGNGFKTSTMRLGADAIVFTCANRGSHLTRSIGMLSYTYLRQTMQDDIIVPMVDFEVLEKQIVPLVYGSQENWEHNLQTILDWSPFSSKEEFMQQFDDLGDHGTKVLVYNLWMNDDGLLEMDFDDDDEDIILRDQGNTGVSSKSYKEVVQSHISYTLRYSLRAYTSILYLRKFSRFQIILRGKSVQQLSIKDELKFSKVLHYKPQVGMDSEDVSVKITIGFAKEAPILGIFGFNVYHKNRLILPFWKVFQEGSSRGRSVVGFLEANFIEPAHDKQDFERTPLFIRLEAKLKHLVVDYWKNNCHLIGYQSQTPETRARKVPKNDHVLAPEVQVQQVSDGQHVIGLPAANGSAALPSFQSQAEHTVMDLTEVCEENESTDIAGSNLFQKLCEENIKLFARRDELQCREVELKQMVTELERELEEGRQKCSLLASELEVRKKQQLL